MTKATILIVEDDGILAMHLQEIISRMGFTVAGLLATGEEAIDFIPGKPVDLVLMDIELAGNMSGITAAEVIHRTLDIPVVFLTGFSQDPLLEQAKIAAPYGYLIKPVPERELAATLEIALHRHMLDRQLKESRIALAQSEANYRHLFQNSPLGIFRTTLDGKALAVNAEMARIVGCTTPEEALDNFTDLAKNLYVKPEQRKEFIALLQANRIVKDFEYEGRTKTGETIWISMNAKLTSTTETNEESGGVVIDGFATDITERKRAEAALRESEQSLTTLADHGQALIWTSGTDKLCNYFNRVWYEFTGRTPEQEMGNGWVEGVHPDDMQRCLDIYVKAFELRQKFSMVYRLRRYDGEYRWLLDDGCPRYDSKGEFIGYIGHCLDITDRKLAEERLEESEATVRKKLQAILEPEGDIGTLELADIIDVKALQSMMEEFYQITKIGIGIIDMRGRVLVGVGWQDICTKFHRQHPETLQNCIKSDTVLASGIPVGTTKAYHCKNNLWDIMTPIEVGGRHLGNVFLGQFFYEDESPDYDLFRAHARKFGFDEKEYLAALDRVPRWSREKVEATMAFYASLSKMISSLSYSTIKLSRTLSQKDTILRQLDANRAFQDSLLQTIPIPVFYKDMGGRYLGVNSACEKLFGKTKEQLLGKTVFDTHPPELARLYHAKDAELFEVQGSQIYEATVQNAQNGLHDVIFHKASLTDTHGTIIGLIGAILDITENKRAEQKLRESEEKHRRLFENMPQGVVYQNANDEIISANPAAESILGLTLDQMRGKSSLDPRWKAIREDGSELPGEEHPSMMALRTGKPVDHFIMGVFKPETTAHTWISVSAIPFFRPGETNPFQVYVTFDDITEQRRAQQNYQTLFREMFDGFALHEIICDDKGNPADYRFLAVNPAFERITGLKAADIIGRTVLEIIPNIEPRWIATYGQVALTGKPTHFESSANDLQKHFEVTAFRPAPGQFACILIDITDRKRAEKERENLQIQLQQAQKMEAIGTLAGGIAHDFNNILGAILGYAEMAQDDCPAESIAASDIGQVIKAGQRARELVKQILAFSRQAETEHIPMQPAVIVKETLKLLRSSLPTTITIKQDLDPQTGLVLADPTQIHQILMNLGTNAYHAMEETGGTLTVSLKKVASQNDLASEPGHFVQLSIADTGSGIAPDIQDKIFDPYFTTKQTGKGTGMGLAIVHGIVKGYGGSVSCQSQPGEGTVFKITLPALEEQVTPEINMTELIPVGTEHILFVDDEDILVEMGKLMLERLGYRVTTRTSSIEALSTFQNQPNEFDLIITDQTMPGMTGSDLCRRILQIRPDMPIILCTGYSNLISAEKARALGIKGFALKPLTKKDIASLIREVLNGGKHSN